MRSIADSQNYGDDKPASELVNPHQFSNLRIPVTILDEFQTKNRIQQMFTKIGYNIDSQIFELLFYEASGRCGGREDELCSMNTYRDVLNEYLKALDNDNEGEYLRSLR